MRQDRGNCLLAILHHGDDFTFFDDDPTNLGGHRLMVIGNYHANFPHLLPRLPA